MSLGLEWSYARGYFCITPDGILHIRTSMPQDVRDRFIPEILKHRDEVRKRQSRFEFRSGDMDFDKIVFDE